MLPNKSYDSICELSTIQEALSTIFIVIISMAMGQGVSPVSHHGSKQIVEAPAFGFLQDTLLFGLLISSLQSGQELSWCESNNSALFKILDVPRDDIIRMNTLRSSGL